MSYKFNPFTGNFDIVNPKADSSVQLTGNQTITGIKTFAEKLLLPNCTLINDVANFYQTTIPTQRVFLVNDLVVTESLIVGDRWYNPTAGKESRWNGTYWVSEQKSVNYNANASNLVTSYTGATTTLFPCLNNGSLLIEFVRMAYLGNPFLVTVGSFTISPLIRRYTQGTATVSNVVFSYSPVEIGQRLLTVAGSSVDATIHDVIDFNCGLAIDSSLIESYFVLTGARIGTNPFIRIKAIDLFYREIITT